MRSSNQNEFVEFLSTKMGVPPKNGRFYLLWVNRFLSFYQKSPNLATNYEIQEFLGSLQRDSEPDWQISQAAKAVKVFLENVGPQRGDVNLAQSRKSPKEKRKNIVFVQGR